MAPKMADNARLLLDELLAELEERRRKVLMGGGPERQKKQHEQGKLTARERIDYLLDEGSFVELMPFAEHLETGLMEGLEAPADGVVTGYGTIGGRLVFVFSQDFTVLGGSLGKMHGRKIASLMDLAAKVGAPVVGLNDSAGARIQEGVDSLSGYGEVFYRNAIYSGVIPQISAILGPCAGGAVYSPAMTDFVLMSRRAYMFITGPEVIKSVTKEEVSFEALGGADVHMEKSGVAHLEGEDDREVLDLIKKLLSYLPQSSRERPPVLEPQDDPHRPVPEVLDIVHPDAKRPYNMHALIRTILDGGEFLEIQPRFARNLIVGLGRLGGYPVGIIANNPRFMAGALDINASDKAARFIRTMDTFGIPLLTFVDVTGFLPGVAQEHGGIIRHGAKMLFAYAEATVPKITLIVRKAYGGAYLAMNSKDMGADVVLAWPTAAVAVMGAEGAANIVFRREIQTSPNPEETRRKKIEEYRRAFDNPWVAAGRGYIDDVIDPAETRRLLYRHLKMLWEKKEERPWKRHDNIPL
jgi:acetyl-CoA carboxylase carboxyltransferase component